MLAADAKRRFETLICALLTDALPARRFYPEQGGTGETPTDPDDRTDELEPPYSVIALGECQSMTNPDGDGFETWQGEATLLHVVHIDDATAVTHSTALSEIRAALAQISQSGRGVYADYGCTLHGLTVTGTPASVDDDERQSHGDGFRLAVGFTA